MKSVLMIAYWFPPEGNAAVYRPLRFLRNLPPVGWRARVISSKGSQYERYDEELLSRVPTGTEVVRVAGRDLWQSIQRKRSERLQRSAAEARGTNSSSNGAGHVTLRSRVRHLVRKAESWCYHPDLQRGWIRPAQEATVQACSRSRPDVIWATGPPWSSFLVAQQVHRRTGIPYVLDFRTSWTLVPDSFEAMRPMWAQQRDRRRLRQLFREARAVVFFYPAEAECFWRAYRGALDASRIHTIPNGFDGEVEECDLPQNDKFTLAYTGTLSDYRYDTFLEALTILRDRSPGRAQQLIVRFVGEGTDSLADAAHRLGLSHLVSTSPPISHAAIHRLQREADALLMLERKPTLKGHELLAGAKLFDYLRAGRPILGVVPDGEAARVLREVGVSTLASPGAPEEICAVLETLLEAWSAGRLASLVPTRSACERYSGTGQAAALARALEGRPALVPFVPGTFDIVPSLMADLAAGEWA